MYMLIRSCCLNLAYLMVPESKERSTSDLELRLLVKKSNKEEKDTLRHQGGMNMHARQKKEPWYWTLLSCPTLH